MTYIMKTVFPHDDSVCKAAEVTPKNSGRQASKQRSNFSNFSNRIPSSWEQQVSYVLPNCFTKLKINQLGIKVF